ncbi:hypothetical protein QBC42DRAFT_7523 [Cladorrhinum samala]|uniref:Uncharacterized protein n=1 Tax=Cladorrhinum samala TaxID=585594 RepID=A0AAV9I0S0_9PEZI|nr:hypothetical protein QBC42DRAFT_7523 [Cladorrhinum samala]
MGNGWIWGGGRNRTTASIYISFSFFFFFSFFFVYGFRRSSRRRCVKELFFWAYFFCSSGKIISSWPFPLLVLVIPSYRSSSVGHIGFLFWIP